MYYIICTILIMVFCIAALTKSTSESEFFLPRQNPYPLQPRKTVIDRSIKHSGEARFEIITSSAGNKQNDLCIKAIPLTFLAPNGTLGPVKLTHYYNAHSLTAIKEVQSGYFTDKIMSARKDIVTAPDNRSSTTVHTGHHYKSTASPMFLFTLIIPVTPFFLTNNKNETLRRISTTASQQCSLRQLRYVVSQPDINNEWVYRRVLKLRSQQEKIRV
jgi:hypothetical protein